MNQSSSMIEKNFNFKILGFLNTENLLKKIETVPEQEWKKFEHRKNFSGQESVNCLPIEFGADRFNAVFNYNYKNNFLFNLFEPELKEIYDLIESFYPGQPYRVMITELPANKNIDEHVDLGYHLENTHRIHLCIKTNDEVIFIVDDEKLNMKNGLLFELNNQKFHAVFNNSNENRLHLIIDWGMKHDSYYK